MSDILTPRQITKTALKRAKKEFGFRVLTSFISRALLMIIPILFSFAVDNISKGHYNKAYIMSIVAIFVYIFYRLFELLNTYSWHKLYNKLYQSFTSAGLETTYDNSVFSLSRISISEYINIMNNDINVICDFYCNLPGRIIRAFEFIIIFIYFFLINKYIGFAGVGVSLLVFFILYLSSKKIEILNQKRAVELDKKSGILHEILLCIKDIKGFNIFNPIKNRTLNASENYVEAYLTQRVVEDIYKYGIILLIEIFRLGLFIYGIYLITKGKMELAVLLVIYNYYAQLIDNFSDFATINVNYRNLKVSENRFNKILEYSHHHQIKNKSKTKYHGEITFDHILYGYKEHPTLNDVSFNIQSGAITCIVGDAASGKTGIADLLLKLNRQHTGQILIDKTDISEIAPDEYYELIAAASNDPAFFNLSIKENLSMIEDDFAKVIKTCQLLDIHEYIIKLKNGYDTTLSSSNGAIDLNVKYLLGIARVLVKDAKIMIFDNIFSNLNYKDDVIVMGILEKIKKNHTIIIFTKDRNILEKSDQVIFMNKNKVAAISKHETLLKKNKLYKDIIVK